MGHKRTDIRNALVSLLKGTAPSYATSAGLKIFSNRTHNIPSSQLPAIIVYDEQEVSVTQDMRQLVSQRRLQMKVDIRVKATEGYDTALDNIAKQVEDLIKANPQLSGTAMGAVYQSTELSFEAAEEGTIGLAILTYEINYRT